MKTYLLWKCLSTSFLYSIIIWWWRRRRRLFDSKIYFQFSKFLKEQICRFADFIQFQT